MFICAICKSSIGPSIPVNKRVAVRRDRSYVSEQGKMSYGWEIVKEVNLCAADAKALDIMQSDPLATEVISFNPAVERYLARRDGKNPPTI